MCGEHKVSVDVDDVSAGGVDGELEGLIAVVGLSMPGDFFVVDIRSPDGDFDAIEVPGFYSLHIPYEDDVFFAVLFSVGFNPADFEGVDASVNGWDTHASGVHIKVGEVRGPGVDPVPFADFLGVVDDAKDVALVIVDGIMD